MKNLKLILALAGSLIISVGFVGFGVWANLAKAEFKIAIEKSSIPSIENNQGPSPSASPAKSIYVLQKGKLVEVDAEQLALEAWNKDKLLPGQDLKYDWFKIGMYKADWKNYFREHGINVDEKKFEAAYTAIAQRSEEHLQERAFEKTRE